MTNVRERRARNHVSFSNSERLCAKSNIPYDLYGYDKTNCEEKTMKTRDSASKDVIIIGGGATGGRSGRSRLCALRGLRVILVERA